MAAGLATTTYAPRPWIPSHPPTNGPVRVLALDGAAGDSLRGYAQIKIVRALMEMIWQKTHPRQPIVESEVDVMRPCDYFNMIVGSGTGGAIAVYLGRLNLTIKECEDHYKDLGDEVYAYPCSMWNPFHRFNYDFERLERVLQEQTRPFYPDNANALNFHHQERSSPECKTAVLTQMAYNVPGIKVLKSYEKKSGEVWQAIRATTASYKDFPNVTVGRLKLIAPDAGYSNPSGKAWIEAITLYPQQNYSPNRGICFISIGSSVEFDNPVCMPWANAGELRIHALLGTIRTFLGGLLSGRAKGVSTVVGYGAAIVKTCAEYGWEFARGSFPGRLERLRTLARDTHTRHEEMLERMREGRGKLHYYRIQHKLDQSYFDYDAWNKDSLRPVLTMSNVDILPDLKVKHAIHLASTFLARPPENAVVNCVRILTLDGSPGALSALVQLKIIRETMGSIWKQKIRQGSWLDTPPTEDIDNMRPAEYFDLIVGSGTGGAIAIYLGWFRLTVKECEDRFQEVGDDVYSAPFSRWSIWQRYNYDQRLLGQVLQDQSRSCNLDTPQHNGAPGFDRKSKLKFCYQEPGDTRCKVAVMASKYPGRTPDILRSYGEHGVDGAHGADVWQVMQATMASHGDFPPVQVGDVSLLGPEAGWSNPAIAALNEARTERSFGRQRKIRLISIGNGLHPELPPPPSTPIEDHILSFMIKHRIWNANFREIMCGRLPSHIHTLRDLALGCEDEHRKMLERITQRPEDLRPYFDPETSKYFRFNTEGIYLAKATAWNPTNTKIVEEWAKTLAGGDDYISLYRLQDAATRLETEAEPNVANVRT